MSFNGAAQIHLRDQPFCYSTFRDPHNVCPIIEQITENKATGVEYQTFPVYAVQVYGFGVVQ